MIDSVEEEKVLTLKNLSIIEGKYKESNNEFNKNIKSNFRSTQQKS